MKPRLSIALLSWLAGLLAVAFSASGWAGSTSFFSASDSVSTSVGSLSDSVQRASNSSSKTTHLTQGDYRIEDWQLVAQDPEHPHAPQLRLQLVALTNPQEPLWLTLPQATAEQAGLTRGQTVHAQNRPYGMVLSNPNPFYVLLDDRTRDDLHTRMVAL